MSQAVPLERDLVTRVEREWGSGSSEYMAWNIVGISPFRFMLQFHLYMHD